MTGSLQLLLAVAGFSLLMAWMFRTFTERMLVVLADNPQPTGSYGWLGKWGLILFGAAWLWSWFTSFSLLREAGREPAPDKTV